MPDLSPYYAEIVTGLGAAAREHDYELLLLRHRARRSA